MMVKKLIGICAISASALLLQACGGGGGDVEYAFLVTNTNKGHVCVNGLVAKADSAEAQTYGKALYYYYGYRGGETDINTGAVTCYRIRDLGARDPDLIISVADFNAIILPAYNARK